MAQPYYKNRRVQQYQPIELDVEGTLVKVYRDKEIGKGAQASVFLGKIVATGEYVACKRTNLESARRDKYVM